MVGILGRLAGGVVEVCVCVRVRGRKWKGGGFTCFPHGVRKRYFDGDVAVWEHSAPSPIRQEGQEKIHTKQTVAQSLNYRWPKNTIYAESAESPFLEAPGVLPALTTRDNGVGISSLVGASPSNTARARCKAEFEPNRVEQENVAQETLTAFPTYPTAIIIVWVFMLVMVGLGSCEFVCLFFFFIYL